MERPRREKKSKVDLSALNALSNAKRGVVSRKEQVQVCTSRPERAGGASTTARATVPTLPRNARSGKWLAPCILLHWRVTGPRRPSCSAARDAASVTRERAFPARARAAHGQ
jgi:hypothetical protein